ncbi:MAG: YggT family protein [Streptococcaceae bacterium]|jgi:YggT family protein|nr:YggT family protein [Streptococcaceae bacterium]
MIYNILSLLSNLITLYSYCILVYALLSWFPGAYQSRLGKLITTIVRPYLRLFDKFPLQFANIDFSVVVALLLLQFGFRGLLILVNLFFY